LRISQTPGNAITIVFFEYTWVGIAETSMDLGISIEIGISHAYNVIDRRFAVKTGIDSCTNAA